MKRSPSLTIQAISLRKRCLFTLIPVTVLLLLAEIVTRCCVSEEGLSRRFEQIERIVVFLGSQPDENLFEPDPDCFWRLKPDMATPVERGIWWGGQMSNSHGMRSREVSVAEAHDRFRVLCFGDSTTFAFGVDFSEAWPNQLQELLDAEQPGAVEVLNAGIPGHTSFQGRQRLARDLIKWQPHLAVITFGNNDGWRWDNRADKDHAPAFLKSGLAWLNHSRAVSWLKSASLRAASRSSVPDESDWARQASWNYFDPNLNWTPRVSLPDFAANLHAMIDACRQQECDVALIVWPDRRQLLGETTWRIPYQEAMRQVAAEAKVTCVDLVPLFEEAGSWGVERFLPRDVIHVDRAGNQMVVRVVAPVVQSSLQRHKSLATNAR